MKNPDVFSQTVYSTFFGRILKNHENTKPMKTRKILEHAIRGAIKRSVDACHELMKTPNFLLWFFIRVISIIRVIRGKNDFCRALFSLFNPR